MKLHINLYFVNAMPVGDREYHYTKPTKTRHRTQGSFVRDGDRPIDIYTGLNNTLEL